ncbi:homocysteine S-methyltransferase family protein [Shewanella sp. A25]|nr:homocysteine S-methyltransferase family protein [Shewanella shenzhenensis]
MVQFRHALPQLAGQLFMTDGGLETTLIFHEHLELPYFAAFHLLNSDEGRQSLLKYFNTYADIAVKSHIGLILETPTWRANADWGELLGYSAAGLAQKNNQAIEMLLDVREQYQQADLPLVISGCIGPRRDGYVVSELMTIDEAKIYHAAQIRTFAAGFADVVTAMTMTYSQEAIGIVMAAKQLGIPVVISFTIETDGRLPSGESLQDAIVRVDSATDCYASYFMINCAHPEHFMFTVNEDDAWMKRIRGIRANASKLSHAELNESEHLDYGDPHELALDYVDLLSHRLTNVNIIGGCCGTDDRHLEQMVMKCLPLFGKHL